MMSEGGWMLVAHCCLRGEYDTDIERKMVLCLLSSIQLDKKEDKKQFYP